MRAAFIQRHGGPEVLEIGDLPDPVCGPDEVLFDVLACGLNHLDIWARRGLPEEPRKPHVLGGDVVVERDGELFLLDPLVAGGALGEHVSGGLAERIAAPRANTIPLPPDADPVVFATLPIAYGTAWKMLFRRAALRRGERVLVQSASGGVGVACVQLALRAGAHVIARTSSDEKGRELERLGAHEVIVGDLPRLRVDVVVDAAGRESWQQSIRAAAPHGRIVTCGATSGHEATMDLRYVFARELSLLGSNGWLREDLEQLVALVAAGELIPRVYAVYPLEEARQAISDLEERRAFGKVVVVPGRLEAQ
jgi:NADPH:quinone reductase-like Zn-dependent oxidoreductase